MTTTPTILIIEDELSFREALAMAMSDEGYTVVTARNGEEALRVLENLEPDLILMDIHMPVMNGIEFLKVYRIKYTRNVPIIVCSTRAHNSELDITDVAAFISKPVDIDDLLKTVYTKLECAS